MEFDLALKDKVETLIISAVHEGDTHSLKNYLLTASNPHIYLNQVYNEPYEQKCTLLMIACVNEYEDMVQMLLTNFTFDLEVLNTVRATDRDQQIETFEEVTVLWMAAAINNFKIVTLLVKHGAQVNHATKTNSTAVRCACCNGNIEIVRYLVKNGADIRIVKEKHFTNLVASVFNGHLQMVAYLVNELDCDVNECLDDGRSPLHAAVSHGSLELVEFLLNHGARNFIANYNKMSPLMLAAEKRRPDLVNIISLHCLLIEQIEAKELLGSAFVCAELGVSDFEQSYEHLYEAFELRSMYQLPKTLKNSTHEIFNHRQECQTIDQLKELQSNENNIYIEALLIRERLLGPIHAKYRSSLRYRGALLADNGQYHQGLALWMYELTLHEQYLIDLYKENLRQFVLIFSIMMHLSLPISVENIHKVISVTIGELKRNAIDFDYNLYTLLFLITIASHIQITSHSEQRVLYHLIYTINQHRYTTHVSGSSLLHLSLNELISADDQRFDYMHKYPCLHTVRILLQCGADVNTIDIERNTPLHIFVSNSNYCDETIFQLLCNANAHLDYVNKSGEIPLDRVINLNIKQLLKTRMNISLKCLCARLIQKAKIPYHAKFNKSIATFVEKH